LSGVKKSTRIGTVKRKVKELCRDGICSSVAVVYRDTNGKVGVFGSGAVPFESIKQLYSALGEIDRDDGIPLVEADTKNMALTYLQIFRRPLRSKSSLE
jgi:hypothetical protein